MREIIIAENDFLTAFNDIRQLKLLIKHFGVSRKVIAKMAKKYNVEFEKHPKRVKIPKDHLIELYEGKNYTQQQIAKELNISLSTVRDNFKNYNIPVNRLLTKKLTETELNVVIGSILGDGYLSINGTLEISHSNKQVDYLLYKQYLLTNICKGIGIDFLTKRIFTGGTSSYRLRTVGVSEIRELREKFYLDKVKFIPVDIESLLTPQSVAIWYMDDGGIKGKGYGRIATCSFTQYEVEYLVKSLNNKFDLRAEVAKEMQYYNIKFRARNDSFNRLVNLIKPFIPECMSYKLP